MDKVPTDDAICGVRKKKGKQKKRESAKQDSWKKRLALIRIIMKSSAKEPPSPKHIEFGLNLLGAFLLLIILFTCLCMALYIYFRCLTNLIFNKYYSSLII